MRFYSFPFVYPSLLIGGMALLATHSARLGVAFGFATWALAFVFVRHEGRADDGT